MEVEMDTSAVAGDLVAALEQATLMAKQIPTTADPSQLFQIQSALRSANHRLSQFLTGGQLPPPPQHTAFPIARPENSVSSAVGGGGEPMQMGDGEEEEQNSRDATTVEKVEGRMRECFIQNKRPKRRLSPSSAVAAEQRRSYVNKGVIGGGAAAADFDPIRARLRSLDLIYQFHA
ncbi:hypothetical protein ABFS82_02G156600 [Erythranthe guttata]|uniref:Uncharacterized protein n=1 Tax=Erythranthe guttata TaxID=4155 RepID=A0A022QZS0_ERYGU|nr:PREDICTED: uncharacterized protein LOC105963752 [Erythranthe guttata]EYU32050.1 hypothetical protein MIMGU_mgv1a020053mg [Erythranthe guttata]|eukprot:XP_012843654.1 PREDICTED: uncharacterized protein LOC105963752 [Erythranthe guttata]